ncbi:MAG: response regulator transcription factor [Verrucomicrobiales bacterium]|nr:response regulator transcription factor [Verrucomicrobiales bacterium]
MSSGAARRAEFHTPRRVMIVDDHPLVRERLAGLINEQPDLRVCCEAADLHEALHNLEQCPPDLAIVDLSLRNSHGLDLIKELHARRARLPILVVSMHDESLYAERALRAGARGYITKQEATQKVLQAMRRVLEGEVFVSPRIAASIAANAAAPGPVVRDGIARLSDRELRVFELIGRGHKPRQIAAELHLDIKTVEAYRARIRTKLGLQDAREVLQHAIEWTRSLD